ncbi:MAG: hypothetical protein IKG15_06225 [Solobacterium sp.]|nr:hypothetical protein [Solobacterium sp.]
MTREELLFEATRFRRAIEKAKEAGEFIPKRFKPERMNNFPHDCCDDTADLFTNYLYHEFEIDSIRINASYYDKRLKCDCYHDWQEIDGWIVDLTGDQFENDPSVPIKAGSIYVGKMDDFHRQFKISRQEHSCGIECLGDGCLDRMYGLYNAIMKHMK